MNPAWVEPIKWDQNLALCRKTPHALGALKHALGALKVTQFIAPVALKIAFYCILREDVVTDIVGGALTEAPQA